jgi:hypothetical protein
VLLGIAGLLMITALAVLRVTSLRDLDSDRVGKSAWTVRIE